MRNINKIFNRDDVINESERTATIPINGKIGSIYRGSENGIIVKMMKEGMMERNKITASFLIFFIYTP